MERIQERYIIKEKLGSGGMATVWRAFDPVLEREVAIKIINENFLGQDDFLERFRREAAIAANLEHKNIAKVYEQGAHKGLPFIVMEYIKGPTLKERLPYLNIEESKRIAGQILTALAYAHSQGILHRDIKSGNVILSSDGAKLIDFGVAQIASAPQITLPGQIIGTAEYMAPEVAEGKEASIASDLYSLAVLFYEMLSGQLPYLGKTALEILHRQAITDPSPPSEINNNCPSYLDAVVFKGLQKNPEKRYQSADQFKEAIFTKKERPRTPAPLLPLLLGLALIAASFFFIEGQKREMIDFTGLNKSEALRLSEKLEINPSFILAQGEGRVGEIFWQSKKPGQSIDSGDRVVFFIQDKKSKQSLRKTMPNLIGKNIKEGKIILERLGVSWQISFSEGEPGLILSSSPPAGAMIKEERVLLEVGRTSVPDLIGENINEAINILVSLGLDYQIEYRQSSEAADIVILQDPAAGSFGEEVLLVVSSPSLVREVPNLLGLSEAEALASIESSGFSALVLYQLSENPGTVERQSPGPGSNKNVGSVIRLWIGRAETGGLENATR